MVNVKCIHNCTEHRGLKHVNNYRSAECIDGNIVGFNAPTVVKSHQNLNRDCGFMLI